LIERGLLNSPVSLNQSYEARQTYAHRVFSLRELDKWRELLNHMTDGAFSAEAKQQ
jgi:hypothetical protein